MKTLAVGGEAFTRECVQEWADNVSLIQIYGPVEVGICLTMYMRNNTSPETVGYPLANSSCWIVDLDNSNLLVSIGAIGQLIVAGPSMAKCYLNNEAKTRSSFISNLPWAQALGLKFRQFYRPGDFLRYSIEALNGSYSFIKRKDSQIKLRGQRLETGEVEHHLASIPGIAISVVIRPNGGCYAGELVAVAGYCHHIQEDCLCKSSR